MAPRNDVDLLVDEAMEMARSNKPNGEKEKPFHLHIADYPVEYNGPEVTIRTAEEDSLCEFTEGLLAAMEATDRPMLITIDIINRYFMQEELEDMKAAITSLSEAAVTSGKHRITWSTMRFCPDLERFWGEVNVLNTFIRNTTVKTGEQMLSLHKIYLAPANGQVVTCPENYKEFVDKSSLGRNPSIKGVAINIDWVVKHHKGAYFHPRNPSERVVGDLTTPIPLGLTAAFTNNVIFLNMLKSRGLYRGRKVRSVSRGNLRRRTSHRTRSRERSDSCVSGARPRGERSPVSISILERLLNRVATGGSTQSRKGQERETRKVTEKIANMYQAKCNEVTQLAIDLETMKLELDLMKEKKKMELDEQSSMVRRENEHLKQALDWADDNVMRLEQTRDSMHKENMALIEELQLVKMNKKDRRAAKKAARRRRN